jgi:flagella basal body P-ring formation protein FlgA
MKSLAAFVLLQLSAVSAPEPTSVTVTGPLAAGAVAAAEDIETPGKTADEFAGKTLRRSPPAGAVPHSPDARSPVLVARNRPVRLEFERGALTITADGRALSNGSEGEMVRVLNLASRVVVTGVVTDVDRVTVK